MMRRSLLFLAVLLGLTAFAWNAGHKLQASSHKPFSESLQLEACGLRPLAQGPTKKKATAGPDLRDGDVLFQAMDSGQGEAIALATGSKWTHVGIVFRENGELLVYEAVGPVKATPLNDWIDQGEGRHYVAKRWNDADKRLDATGVKALRAAVEPYWGKAYDWQFMWDDQKIYCSELVWKLYRDAFGVELCAPKPLREHTLDSELVQATMRQRYGSAPPMDEPMIAPGALFDCPLLTTVLEK